MQTLIIYAHPNTNGHCSNILGEVENRLKETGKDYEVLDLYKIKYDPILHENEHYTAGNKHISEQNKEFQNKIKDADKLIFIYPVWWGTMPAILKGFIDRVLVPGFAYRFSKFGIPQGFLKDKKAVVFMTTGGNRFLYLLIGNRPKRLMKTDILSFVGIKSRVFMLDNAKKFDNKKKSRIKRMVKEGIFYLF